MIREGFDYLLGKFGSEIEKIAGAFILPGGETVGKWGRGQLQTRDTVLQLFDSVWKPAGYCIYNSDKRIGLYLTNSA